MITIKQAIMKGGNKLRIAYGTNYGKLLPEATRFKEEYPLAEIHMSGFRFPPTEKGVIWLLQEVLKDVVGSEWNFVGEP